MMTPYDRLTDRLTGLRRAPAGHGIARAHRALCPAHQADGPRPGRSPSLSLAETIGGAVLLHCHAGCPAGEIASSVGLAIADLFPPRTIPHSPGLPGWWSAAAIADRIYDEAIALALLTLDPGERVQAAAEIGKLAHQFRTAARHAMRPGGAS